MVILAVPRLGFDIEMAVGNDAMERVYSSTASAADRELARATRTAALTWHANPKAWSDLGWLLASDIEATAEPQPALTTQAEATVMEALSLSPANPFDWGALAYHRLMRRSDAGMARAALMMSIRVAPHERGPLFGRISYALSLWPVLTPDERGVFDQMISDGWGVAPSQLCTLTSQRAQSFVIQSALARLRDARTGVYYRECWDRLYGGQGAAVPSTRE